MSRNLLLAVLATSQEAVSIIELANKLGTTAEEVKRHFVELNDALSDLSLKVVLTEEYAQLVVRPEYTDALRKLQGGRVQRLSDAAYETLVMVIYHQPVTRQEIEEIRGVDCEKTLDSLVRAGLIKAAGQSTEQGRPALYTITPSTPARFGCKSYSELLQIVSEHIDKIKSKLNGE